LRFERPTGDGVNSFKEKNLASGDTVYKLLKGTGLLFLKAGIIIPASNLA
jgi:hypothetical protein